MEKLKRIFRSLQNPGKAFRTLRYLYCGWNDFRIYRAGLKPYRRFLPSRERRGPGLLIVAGMGMNPVWAQLWTLLSLPAMRKGYVPYVLLSPLSRYLERYFKLAGIRTIPMEAYDSVEVPPLAPALRQAFDAAIQFQDIRDLSWNRMPIGDIALSTYCRHTGTVMIDINDPAVRASLWEWLNYLWRHYHLAQRIFSEFGIKTAYFTETFMEEYGAIYYAALGNDLNILRFAGTVRDDAIIVQHRDWASERLHHAALAPSSWEAVKRLPN